MNELIQQLPGNAEAERAILGAILLDETGSAYDQAISELIPDDFSLDSHRRIFSGMVEVFEAGSPIDFVTLTESLGHRNEIESVGGVVYVTTLTDGLPRLKNISHHVRIVKHKAALRQIIRMADGAANAAYEQDSPASHILATLQEGLLTLLGDQRKGAALKVAEFSQETWNRLVERRESTNRLVGFSTGIEAVDFKTTGIRRGEFWTIGGRTGDGKTSFALQIATANARDGVPVGYFSVEMDRHSLLERVWSAYGQVDYRGIRNPKRLSPDEAGRLAQVKEQVDRWPLFIEDSESYSIAEIEARARLMVRQHKVAVVIVDYLQIVDAPGKEERHRLTKISKGLRMLAKAENIGVIGLSQMPRPQDRNMNKRPNKFDLKESGSIENDSNTVLLIFRPVNELDDYTGLDEIIGAKQRSGETFKEPVVYVGKHMSFYPRAL